MANKKIYGLYDNDEILVKGAKALVEKGVHITTTYSPFPIHGIEEIIGMKWTRLAICAFIFGITGTAFALGLMWFCMVYDWPMNIGGKPSFSMKENMLAFIPITFELTVLFAGHGMAITMLIRNWTLPGVAARNPHPKTTDDHFAIEIETIENGNFSKEEINSMISETGPVEVFEK